MKKHEDYNPIIIDDQDYQSFEILTGEFKGVKFNYNCISLNETTKSINFNFDVNDEKLLTNSNFIKVTSEILSDLLDDENFISSMIGDAK